jgi:hypothetical protein
MIHEDGQTKRAKLTAALRNFTQAPKTLVSFQKTPITIVLRDMNAKTVSNIDSSSEINIRQLGQ